MKGHTDLVKRIVQYLNTVGHFAWKNQTGVVRKDGCWIQYGYPGSPDIFCVMKGGKFLGVEVKTGDDVQKEKQKLFEDILVTTGGHYIIARSFDCFMSAYQELLSLK